jgi:hypothetical protein
MRDAADPPELTESDRLREAAAILAAGFLRLKCRRGYAPAGPPESAESGSRSAEKTAAGIPRNCLDASWRPRPDPSSG